MKEFLSKTWCLIDPETKANTNVPNIGLAYISAAFKILNIKHQVIDHSLLPFKKNRFLKSEAEVFGLSIKCNTLKECERITNLLREKKGDKIKIVWGGPHVRGNLKDLEKEYSQVDSFYPGYLDQDILEITGKNISGLPHPIYKYFDSRSFLEDQFKFGFFHYPIMTSRGCPYGCSYCQADRRFTYRSAQDCIEEIKNACHLYGTNNIYIMDDNFIMKRDRALEFCYLIKDMNIRWACPNGIRADQFDHTLAQAMKEAGCYHISFGIESVDPVVLKEINKGETIEQIEAGIQVAHSVKMSTNGFFILGLPGSSYESDYQSFLWSKKMGIQAHFGILVPIPGTKIYKEYHEFVNKDFVSESLFFDDNREPVIAYETPEYTKEERLQLYNRIREEQKR